MKSIGQHTESIMAILKREVFNIFRKGVDKFKWAVKNKDLKMMKSKVKVRKDEGVIYKIECKNCDKIYIGETKLKVQKILDQHKKDVQRINENIAVVNHVMEQKQTFD